MKKILTLTVMALGSAGSLFANLGQLDGSFSFSPFNTGGAAVAYTGAKLGSATSLTIPISQNTPGGTPSTGVFVSTLVIVPPVKFQGTSNPTATTTKFATPAGSTVVALASFFRFGPTGSPNRFVFSATGESVAGFGNFLNIAFTGTVIDTLAGGYAPTSAELDLSLNQSGGPGKAIGESGSFSANATPEPVMFTALGLGIAGLMFVRRKRTN